MSARFTIDGGYEVEQHLARICSEVAAAVRSLVPEHRLEGLVVGGGYGRGQGGVLVRENRELPYNDLEFYVFLRGSRLLNERRHGQDLVHLGERLSPEAGLHVEFKIEALARLRASPVSMFSYDLLAGHRLLLGGDELFDGCEHHLLAHEIPMSEATRLLVNRCTGLLLAGELLRHDSLAGAEEDFIARNIAKARLALGDAILTTCGQYHWSCLERHARLLKLAESEVGDLACLDAVRHEHAAGAQFKLHPVVGGVGRPLLAEAHERVSALAERVWLWVESRRLKQHFANARQYAEFAHAKWTEGPGWRNCLLNLRTFGLRGVLSRTAHRYPRERLLNTLPLLLWNQESVSEPRLQRHLQQQLQTTARDWSGLVGAYKAIWPAYG